MGVAYQWSRAIDRELRRRIEVACNELVTTYPKVSLLVNDTNQFPPESYAATATPDNGRSAIIMVSSTMGTANEWDRNAHEDVARGFHPVGFADRGGVEGVITHEFGHVLAFSAGIPPTGPQPALIVASWLPGTSHPSQVSGYATQSPQETLAEAFAEYRCSKAPRHLSTLIARTLIEAYRTGSPLV